MFNFNSFLILDKKLRMLLNIRALYRYTLSIVCV